MSYRLRIRRALLVPLSASVSAAAPGLAAQSPEQATRASTGWTYELANRVTTPRGMTVLLPGFGGSFADFSDSASASPHRSTLADSLASRGIALLLVAPPPGVLFGGTPHITQLEATIVEAAKSISNTTLPLAIGGFSAGGTDAVLLAERCGVGRCTMPHTIRAVFAVDAPLDWHRLWENAMLVLRDKPAGANVAEAQVIQQALVAQLGKTPTSSSRRYLEASPLATKARDGGNARTLSTIAVRAYTEPDVQWWMENRGLDYYGMNALDAAALIRHLKVLGNVRAELIVTSGRGYRRNGARHPHSWSIVDQADLADWLARTVLPR